MDDQERPPPVNGPAHPTLTRRALAAAAALVLTRGAHAAAPAAFPDGATLLVAGPGGGPVDGWAEWLTPGLGRALPPGTPVRKNVVGGLDGVTGANQFEARTVPDGTTALLLPGSAAMAWLVGDPRARFDAAQWVPTLAAVTPSLVMGRAGTRLGTGRLRIARSEIAGAALPAMLALDLLGVDWMPVDDVADADAATALARGQIDAVCLHGRRVPDMAQALAETGARPLFSFGTVSPDGHRLPDAAFPDTPTLAELLATRHASSHLVRAWQATAVASELDVAMVLPHLSPAAMVALWRRAVVQVLGSDQIQLQASAQAVRPLTQADATATNAALLADTAVQIELRRWLASRLNYRPT